MTTRQLLGRAVAALSLALGLIGAALWFLNPAKAGDWIAVVLFLPGVWAVGTVILGRLERVAARRLNGKGPLVNYTAFLAIVTGVGAMLAVVFGAALAGQLRLIGPETFFSIALRGSGIVFGVMAAALGNAFPKMMLPLPRAATAVSEARAQAFKRFTGWVTAVGGVAYVANWLFMPIPFPAFWIGLAILAVAGLAPAAYGLGLAFKARHAQA